MPKADPFAGMVGPRRPLGIGISVEEFRINFTSKPSETELRPFSSNPRNAAGEWYEKRVGEAVAALCDELSLERRQDRRIAQSLIYRKGKVVDILVGRPGSPRENALGLEVKFLGGDGSLVQPKAVIDAIDFTGRPFHCLYVIDGEGWLASENVEYLDRWWEFTCLRLLNRTVRAFFRPARP